MIQRHMAGPGKFSGPALGDYAALLLALLAPLASGGPWNGTATGLAIGSGTAVLLWTAAVVVACRTHRTTTRKAPAR